MLTTQEKEEIKRLVGEMIAEFSPSSSAERKYAGEVEDLDALQIFVARLRDLVVNQGFTELTFLNPATGDRRLLNWSMGSGPLVEVSARAIEVFGTREKALRWLGTPVRALDTLDAKLQLLSLLGGDWVLLMFDKETGFTEGEMLHLLKKKFTKEEAVIASDIVEDNNVMIVGARSVT